MKKQKLGLALVALCAPLISAPALTGSVFAADEEPTTYTVANFGNDAGFFNCIKAAVEAESTATEIPIADVQAITSLTCDNTYNIQKTTGLNLLKALTKLILSGQANLTSIAPTNTTLKELYVHDSGLTSADLSKTTNLAKLSLANNKLTAIDLSANAKLSVAWLYGNDDIKSIDASKLPNSITELYLDDDVLIKSKSIALQMTKDGDYYASPKVYNDEMFSKIVIMSGIYKDNTKITTEGIKYFNSVLNPDKCVSNDPFCIIINKDVEDYPGYIQLEYKGAATSAALISAGQDSSKQNYRIQIKLQEYDPDLLVPDTGFFTGEMDGTKAIIYTGAVILGAGTLYLIVYSAKRGAHRNRFRK